MFSKGGRKKERREIGREAKGREWEAVEERSNKERIELREGMKMKRSEGEKREVTE